MPNVTYRLQAQQVSNIDLGDKTTIGGPSAPVCSAAKACDGPILTVISTGSEFYVVTFVARYLVADQRTRQ